MSLNRHHETEESDATVGFKHELKMLLTKQFPLIRGGRSDAAELLTHFDPQATPPESEYSLRYVAFQPDLLSSNVVTQWVLDIALARAANPGDPAFGLHGYQEHAPFIEVLDTIREANRQQRLGYEWIPQYIEDARGKKAYKAERLLLATPVFERTAFRPQPFVDSQQLKDKDAKTTARILRKYTRESGVGRALLVAAYAAVEAHTIMNALGDETLKSELKSARLPYITSNRREDWQLLNELLKAVTATVNNTRYARRTPEAYQEAVLLLENRNILPKRSIEFEGLRFTEVQDQVQAIAIFLGMTEMAQKTADPAFGDPARTKHIDQTYGKLATTILATAFFPDQPRLIE